MTYAVEVNMTRFDLRSCKMYQFLCFLRRGYKIVYLDLDLILVTVSLQNNLIFLICLLLNI